MTDDRFYPLFYGEVEGPSKGGWVQGMGGGRQLIVAIAVVGRGLIGDQSEVLKEREGKDEIENS